MDVMATTPAAQTPRQRLAHLMDERRGELGMTWAEVADAAGLTKEGIRGARYGEGQMRRLTKAGIERALRWATGSVDTVLAGGSPVVADDDGQKRTTAENLTEAELMMAELRERLDRLSPRRRRAVLQLVRELDDGPTDTRTG